MRIIIITAHFPSYDFPGKTYATQFLYDYAYEWSKENEVHIVHFARKYPNMFYKFARILSAIGVKRFNKYVVDLEAIADRSYTYNGVYIHRIGFTKYIPHGNTTKGQIDNLSKELTEIYAGLIASADLLIGDCIDPLVQVFSITELFKEKKCLQIIHDTDIQMLKKKSVLSTLSKFDALLLRSQKQKKIISNYIRDFNYAYMFSGIPYEQVNKTPEYRTETKRLLYVGALYKSKGLDTIIDALAKSTNDYQLTIVGEGIDRQYFENKVDKLGIQDKVLFVGKVPHSKVFEYMRAADLLLLISRETFGMVYVEAMSQGCIPVAALGEGIDGVVVNGENGFLSPLDDADALTKLLDSLYEYSEQEIQQLSKNAFETARHMTNQKLALTLLNSIKKSNYSRNIT